VASRRNIAIVALALCQAGYDCQAATIAIRAVYTTHWPAEATNVINDVYSKEIWRAAQQLISTKVLMRDAAKQLRAHYAPIAADLILFLSTSYYLAQTPNAVTNLAEAMQAAGYELIETSAAINLMEEELMSTEKVTTAVIKKYSLALSFNTSYVSRDEYVNFLDPLTSINMALSQDGNGNWKAILTNAHEGTHQYREPISVKHGDTVPIGIISIGAVNNVNYFVQFSNDENARIFESIRATIIGV
jgi:hypothetical protein